jgi:hypothetical protein
MHASLMRLSAGLYTIDRYRDSRLANDALTEGLLPVAELMCST